LFDGVQMFDETLLVWKVKHGNAGALKRLYEAYKGDLLAVAASILSDSRPAAAVLKETFVSFAEDAGRLRALSNVRNILLMRASQAARRRLKAKRYEVIENRLSTGGARQPPLEETGPPVPRSDNFNEINKILESIPLEQREAVILHLRGRVKLADIAALQHISTGTVEGRYHYGLSKLRDLFARQLMTENVERAIETLHLSVSAEVDERIIDEATEALRRREKDVAGGGINRAAAAVAAGAVLAAVLWGGWRWYDAGGRTVPRQVGAVSEPEPPATTEKPIAEFRAPMPPPPAPVDFTVEVVDERTDQPLSGQYVRVVEQSRMESTVAEDYTDADGLATTSLSSGRYTVLVVGWKNGGEHLFSQDFMVEPGSEAIAIRVPVSLRPRIFGWLVNEQGRPVPGKVSLAGLTVPADRTGEFSIPEPRSPSEPVYVGRAIDSEGQLGISFSWLPHSLEELELTLVHLAAVTGRLEDRDGSPVSSAMVELVYRVAGRGGENLLTVPAATAESDGEGRFMIDRITVGLPMAIVVEGEGFDEFSYDLPELRGAETLDIGRIIVQYKAEAVAGAAGGIVVDANEAEAPEEGGGPQPVESESH